MTIREVFNKTNKMFADVYTVDNKNGEVINIFCISRYFNLYDNVKCLRYRNSDININYVNIEIDYEDFKMLLCNIDLNKNEIDYIKNDINNIIDLCKIKLRDIIT